MGTVRYKPKEKNVEKLKKYWGTVYNESWIGEYIFTKVVGDANDLEKRVADDSGTMEAHICLEIR